MNKGNSFLHYIKNSLRKPQASLENIEVKIEFAEDSFFNAACEKEKDILEATMREIYLLVRRWSEAEDYISADTKKPT